MRASSLGGSAFLPGPDKANRGLYGALFAMKFKITRHAAVSPPEHALDLLEQRLGRRRKGVSFVRVGSEIKANVNRDDPVNMTQDERTDVGRRAVLEIVSELCEHDPDLELEWYAVSPAR